MEWEFDPVAIGVAAVFYIVIMIGVWKVSIGEGWNLTAKIALTVITPFMCYFIVLWQVNK